MQQGTGGATPQAPGNRCNSVDAPPLVCLPWRWCAWGGVAAPSAASCTWGGWREVQRLPAARIQVARGVSETTHTAKGPRHKQACLPTPAQPDTCRDAQPLPGHHLPPTLGGPNRVRATLLPLPHSVPLTHRVGPRAAASGPKGGEEGAKHSHSLNVRGDQMAHAMLQGGGQRGRKAAGQPPALGSADLAVAAACCRGPGGVWRAAQRRVAGTEFGAAGACTVSGPTFKGEHIPHPATSHPQAHPPAPYMCRDGRQMPPCCALCSSTSGTAGT